MRYFKRLICFLCGHKPKEIYKTYVRDGRRFIECCTLYRCNRCGLIYVGYGVLIPEIVAIIKATLKDLPPTKMFQALTDYDIANRLYKK